ncbi:MAG: hypothetical protein NTZ40_01705 [Cyanobacteria bacterium]|nr:hypothetical protein [Cyanobacteriota bacterium]
MAAIATLPLVSFHTPANAAPCSGTTSSNKTFSYADLTGAIIGPNDTYTCSTTVTSGNNATVSFTYSDLQAFTGFPIGVNTVFNWVRNSATQYTLVTMLDSDSLPVQQGIVGSFNYSITLTDPTRYWNAYNTDFQGESVTPQQTRTTSLQGNNGTTTASYTNPTNSTNATALMFLGKPITTSLVSSWVGQPQNNIFQKSDQFTLLTQVPLPPVPGPLPILGGGIAFVYSRRLRSRIAKSIA